MSRRAGQEPGVVELRLSGTAEDCGTVISLLERISAGLPVTTITISLEVLHRSGPRANRRDPGERTYMLVRVRQDGGRS